MIVELLGLHLGCCAYMPVVFCLPFDSILLDIHMDIAFSLFEMTITIICI